MKIPTSTATTLGLILLLSLTGQTPADNWPGLRGPNHDGASNETGLPEKWSSTKNIVWNTPLPGESAATPIVWGDRVFISSTDKESDVLYALCINAATGEILWKKEAARAGRMNDNNTMASPSPVTDGTRAVFTYGNGHIVAFDFDGNRIWSRNLVEEYGPLSFMWNYSSSPLIFEGRLYVPVIRNKVPYGGASEVKTPLDSFLLCLDPATGKDLWRTPRESDADGESLESYTTPIPMKVGDSTEIILAGADYVTCHDPKTGLEIRRFSYNPDRLSIWRLVPSPEVGEGRIFCVQPGHGALFAFTPEGTGTVEYSKALWTYNERRNPDVVTPLYYRGRLYIMHEQKRSMTCLDPKTGTKIWESEFPVDDKFYASPTAADGKIYCMNVKGETFVVAAGDEFKIISRASMGGTSNPSSIAVAGGRLFIRTSEKLFCVGRTTP